MPNIDLNNIKGLLVHDSDIKTITRNNIVIWQGGFNFSYTGEFIYNGVTYSNTSLNIDEEDFEVMFTSSGIFTPSSIFTDKIYRAFLVGGGGAGGHGRHTYPTRGGSVGGGGGAGGYNTTGNISMFEGSPYEIIIGAGGQSDSARGGTTSAFGLSAEGGYGGNVGNPNDAYQAARQSGGTGYGGKSSYSYMTWWWEGWWDRNFREGENGGNGVQAFGRGDYLYGAGGAVGSGSEMTPSFASIYSGGTNGGGNGIHAFTTRPATATGYGAGGAGGNGGFKHVEDEYEYGDASGGFGHSGVVILTSY